MVIHILKKKYSAPIKKIFEQMYQRYPRRGRSRTKEKMLGSEESQPDPQIQM